MFCCVVKYVDVVVVFFYVMVERLSELVCLGDWVCVIVGVFFCGFVVLIDVV